MTQDQMIQAIIAAIATESNLLIVLQAQVTASLQLMDVNQLQALCATLNIDTSGNGS